MRKIPSFILFCLLSFSVIKAQSLETLRQKIDQVLEDKRATAGVAIDGANPQDTLSINGNKHLPMQSVFKFHLALAVLNQVDEGKFSMEESISITPELIQSYEHLWSPLREKYPGGGEVTLAEIIKYTVAWSDNLGCDLLFERIGGPKTVEAYLHQIGIEDIAIVHPEIMMQAKWEWQYENWTTARAANQALHLFFENPDGLLSTESYNFLLDVLKGTVTGKKRIRGLLPEETIVAHKTGSSGKNDEGLIAASNDIGIVFLPDNTHFFISVLVSDSMESNETNERIIAEIAKLTWDYFSNQ
ncbi:MAG: class A beta-lactamase, subclass A2 [Cyclobacteriaceae bacterium]